MRKPVRFPSPRGDKLQQRRLPISIILKRFPSPRGDKLQHNCNGEPLVMKFPSPRGDKLQPWILRLYALHISSFRPLAGINCNFKVGVIENIYTGFRPLAGINCNPAHGYSRLKMTGFRPLAGINCNLTFEQVSTVLNVSVPSRG